MVRILSPQKAVVRFDVTGPIIYRGVEQLVARQAHNLEVARSNRASATTLPYGVMASTEVSKTFSLGSNPSGATIINIKEYYGVKI